MRKKTKIMKDILLVDDESGFLASLAEGLKSIYGDNCHVFTANSGVQAVEMLKNVTIDVVVTDLHMPEMDGIELILYLKKNYPRVSVVVMTAFSDVNLESLMQNRRVKYVAEKPIDLYDIADHILAA